LDQVADALYKRLQDDEKETLLRLFIKKESSKRLEKAARFPPRWNQQESELYLCVSLDTIIIIGFELNGTMVKS